MNVAGVHKQLVQEAGSLVQDYPYPIIKINPQQTGKDILGILALLLTDLLGFCFALLIGLSIRIYLMPAISTRFTAALPPGFYNNIWWITILLMACLTYEGVYLRRMSFWRETKSIVQAVSLGFLLILAVISLGKLAGEFSRTTIVLTYFFAIMILPLCRYFSKNIFFKLGLWNESVLIMGAGETGKMVARALINEPYLGYTVCGFLEDDPIKKKNNVIIKDCNYLVLGGFKDAPRVIENKNIKHVILAAPGLPGSRLVELVNKLKNYCRSVEVIPDLPGMSVAGGQLDYLFNDQIIAYRTRNNLASPINIAAKFLFDIIIGGILFIILIPIMIFLYIIIRLDSKGPAIYSGNRIGRKGKEFKCYKFRTMYLNNDEILEKHLSENPEAKEEWVKYAKLKGGDPRVTRIGKYLRKLSLDELPQILNVLKGDMSLVGARPYLPQEREKMGSEADTILIARPGITGLWQVSGRNEIDFAGRVELETRYIRNWSMWLDISLLFRTVSVVLGEKGAY